MAIGRNALVRKSIRYFQQNLVVRRDVRANALSSYSASGKWVDANSTVVNILGAVVNLSAKEVQQLPEAERAEGMVALYTEDAVYPTDDEAAQFSDILEWQGNDYRLIKVYNREQGIFNKAICGLNDKESRTMEANFG